MPSKLEQLITALADTDKPVPHTMLGVLSGLQPPEIEHFLAGWSRLPESRRRQVTARLLEMNEDDVNLDFEGLMLRLLADPDAKVRRQAVGGLWESENTSLIRTFVRMLNEDADSTVQAAAAQALGKYSVWVETDRLRTSYRETLAEALLAAYHDVSRPPVVRRRALESLAPLDVPEVEEAIKESYVDSDRQLKVGALYAMGVSCRSVWQPILRHEMENTDSELRYEAVTALGEIGRDEDIPFITGLTEDADLDVALAAIRALGNIGGDEAKKALQPSLENPREALREAAIQTIAEINAADDPLSFEF